MTKAAVTVFYQYFPRVDNQYKTQSKVYFNQVKKWSDQLDKFYIIDAGWNFTPEELPDNAIVIKEDMQSHWHYLNRLTEIADTDALLYLDPDIVVYDPKVISDGFAKLEQFDAVGILDNSATYPMENDFPFLQPNKLRGTRRRFTPYLTFIKSHLVKGLDFTPVPVQFDSMGLVTREVLKKGITFHELEDDRNTLRMDENGNFTTDTWLDGPSYEWSSPADKKKDLGYYHIRNSSVGLGMLKEFKHEKWTYDMRKETMPFTEVMRLLMWQWIYDMKAGEDWSQEYWPVLDDFGISRERWMHYANKMLEYYNWIEKL